MTAPHEDAQRRQWMQAEFVAAYGAPPTVWTRAPGRVDLMGSHTDYNQGWVLTMAIDRDAWVAARPRVDGCLRVRSLDAGGEALFDLAAIRRDEALLWPNYVAGVAWALQEAGHALRGCDMLVQTTVPLSSGLSSSAALEMAASVALEAISGFDLDPVMRARLGQRAENAFVGVNCGILDQYTSSVGEAGSALALDCCTLRSEAAPIASAIGVVICDTKAKRELAASQYGMRRAQCEEAVRILAEGQPGITALGDLTAEQFHTLEHLLPETEDKRARFIVEENARVLAMARALQAGDRAAIAALTQASFAGARDLYEITIPEMERMVEAMLAAPGVIGARQAGAGFGGCMVAFVDVDRVEEFAAAVEQSYAVATGLTPAIYAVRAAQGAGVLGES